MSGGDWFGAAATITVAAILAYVIFIWAPEQKLQEKREIQCETLDGDYYEGRCVEIAGTIELPEEDK